MSTHDPRPQPGDGPDYWTELWFWGQRQPDPAAVLVKHVHQYDETDWNIDYGCSCGVKYSRTGLGYDHEPCHDEHAAHQVDMLRDAGFLL